jgi:hypothetical protein
MGGAGDCDKEVEWQHTRCFLMLGREFEALPPTAEVSFARGRGSLSAVAGLGLRGRRRRHFAGEACQGGKSSRSRRAPGGIEESLEFEMGCTEDRGPVS